MAIKSSWKHLRTRMSKSWQRFWDSFWFRGEGAEGRFAGWVARLTFVLCIIGAFQAWIFLQSERASIGISGVALMPDGTITADQEVKIVVTIKNGGKGDIEIIDGRLNVGDPHRELPAIPHYTGDTPPWQTIILPDDTGHLFGSVKLDGKPVRFTASDVADINAGKLNIWIYGYITYRDRLSGILGSETVGYCYRYRPESNVSIGMFASCGSAAYVFIH